MSEYLDNLRHEANCWGTDTHEAEVVHEAADLIEALEATISRVEAVVERGYPSIGPYEQCSHGRPGTQDCIACYDEAITKALTGEAV